MEDAHAFESQATVFILEKREWKERGSGLVRFVFDLKTYALILINNPNTRNEFSCRLKPRIRSKGPRAYVIRAESDENNSRDKMILAVRFEREKDSQAFRRFVERREPPIDNPQPRNEISNQNGAPFGVYRSPYPQGNPNVPMAMGQMPGPPPGPQQGYLPRMPAHPSLGERSFFWTCPSCVQMNDALATACVVCGNYKPMSKKQGDMEMRGVIPTPNRAHGQQGGGITVRPGTLPQMAPLQGGAYPMPTFERFPSSKSLTQPVILELTVENLGKHNRLVPPKKRNPKDIIIEQIKYHLQTYQ